MATDYKYKPPKLRNRDDLDIPDRILVFLILSILKDAATNGETELGISKKMKMPLGILKPIFPDLKNNAKFIATKAGCKVDNPTYVMTGPGEQYFDELSKEIIYKDYVAPVSLESYVKSVHDQLHKLDLNVTLQKIIDTVTASHLIFPQDLLKELKTLLVNRRPFLIYGPPGNGKTAITETFYQLLDYTIYLPHAIYLNKRIYPFFIDGIHKSLDHTISDEEEKELDNRWIYAKPPKIVVHTNADVDSFSMFGLTFPPQISANLGMMIIDDFGRNPPKNPTQKSAIEILNRFISLFEDEEDMMDFGDGRAVFPVKERIILSSNMQMTDILDQAFRRRLPFNLETFNPPKETAKKIFVSLAIRLGCEQPEDELNTLFDYLHDLYQEQGKMVPGSDARDFQTYIRAQNDEGKLHLTRELLADAFRKRYDLNKDPEKEKAYTSGGSL